MRLQGEVVTVSKKESDGLSSADKFIVILEAAVLNAAELCAYCRERDLCMECVGGSSRADSFAGSGGEMRRYGLGLI